MWETPGSGVPTPSWLPGRGRRIAAIAVAIFGLLVVAGGLSSLAQLPSYAATTSLYSDFDRLVAVVGGWFLWVGVATWPGWSSRPIRLDLATLGFAFACTNLLLHLLPWPFFDPESSAMVLLIVAGLGALGASLGGDLRGWVALAVGFLLGVAADFAGSSWILNVREEPSLLTLEVWRVTVLADLMVSLGLMAVGYVVVAVNRRIVPLKARLSSRRRWDAVHAPAAMLIPPALAIAIVAVFSGPMQPGASLYRPSDTSLQRVTFLADRNEADPALLQPGHAIFEIHNVAGYCNMALAVGLSQEDVARLRAGTFVIRDYQTAWSVGPDEKTTISFTIDPGTYAWTCYEGIQGQWYVKRFALFTVAVVDAGP
jgi:hypothetical protein